MMYETNYKFYRSIYIDSLVEGNISFTLPPCLHFEDQGCIPETGLGRYRANYSYSQSSDNAELMRIQFEKLVVRFENLSDDSSEEDIVNDLNKVVLYDPEYNINSYWLRYFVSQYGYLDFMLSLEIVAAWDSLLIRLETKYRFHPIARSLLREPVIEVVDQLRVEENKLISIINREGLKRIDRIAAKSYSEIMKEVEGETTVKAVPKTAGIWNRFTDWFASPFTKLKNIF